MNGVQWGRRHLASREGLSKGSPDVLEAELAKRRIPSWWEGFPETLLAHLHSLVVPGRSGKAGAVGCCPSPAAQSVTTRSALSSSWREATRSVTTATVWPKGRSSRLTRLTRLPCGRQPSCTVLGAVHREFRKGINKLE